MDGRIHCKANSEWAAPIVIVRKKDDSIRLCVDFTLLNRVIKREHFPIHVMEDVLDRLTKGRVFSTLDMKEGFKIYPSKSRFSDK